METNDDFKREEWQGHSKESVVCSYIGVAISVIGITCLIIGLIFFG